MSTILRSRGTSQRRLWQPLGNTKIPFVALGNTLISRCVLLCYLASARGVRWVVEQPSSSSMPDHPRWGGLRSQVKVRGCTIQTTAYFIHKVAPLQLVCHVPWLLTPSTIRMEGLQTTPWRCGQVHSGWVCTAPSLGKERGCGLTVQSSIPFAGT